MESTQQVDASPVPDTEDMSDASSAGKALALLEAVVTAPGPIGVSQLARQLQLPKSTVHRLLQVLCEQDFVGRAGPEYETGSRFFKLSYGRTEARLHQFSDLRDVAVPVLEYLFTQTQLTVHLAVLDGTDVFYLEKISAHDGCRIPSAVSRRVPATCTALGKVILAHATEERRAFALGAPLARMTRHSVATHLVLRDQLNEAIDRGIAFDHEESRLGVQCVAAPILVEGEAVAAVSVAGSSKSMVKRSSTSVQRAAARITQYLHPPS